ncbi:glycoside hydrolase superfamily [Chiua virens]|nr:glycoside hydrolase superfamily [Chiua virens]
MSSIVFSLLTFISFFPIQSSAADAQQWRSRSIYQVMTDRFALQDVSNGTAYNVPCNTSALQYCGGTWGGIIDHLDYIQGMGFDAIWISPPFANVEGQTPMGEAYHGYWPQDLTQLNSHFGTAKDLKNLSDSLHLRGMYLMLDIVVNHMVSSRPFNLTAVQLAMSNSTTPVTNTTRLYPFTDLADFHQVCWITDYSNQTEVEQCWLGNESMPWADVDTERPEVIGTLNSWISDVISDFGVDGLRLSTVKFVSKEFWTTFTTQAGIFTMGEVFSMDVSYTSSYTGVMSAVLDYPTWFELVPAFASPQGDFNALKSIVQQAQGEFNSGTFMTGSFLENHDQPRFVRTQLRANAIVWPFVHDGIPTLYYGQEQGLSGGQTPSNHEAMWHTRYDPEHPLYMMVTALNQARKAAITSEEYFLTTPMQFLDVNSSNMLVVSKPPILALLTNIGSQQTSSRENGGVTIESDEANVWRGFSQTIGLSNEEVDQDEEEEDAGVQIEISRMPEILPVFHPSDPINQYILQKEPSAKVAITHDNVWGSILDNSVLKPEGLVRDDLLTKAVSEIYTIVSREGVAYLQSKSCIDVCVLKEYNDVEGENNAVQPCQPQPLSVVSESSFRCVDPSAPKSIGADSEPAGLHRLYPSKFGASGSSTPESLRPIKIIVLSDYICAFCYVCDKYLQDAIEACRDLPVRFDVEFRPFTILNASFFPGADSNQPLYRNAYVAKKYGKEQAEMKIKAAHEFAAKAGLKLADDSILCVTTQAHRLSAKALKNGGQELQEKFNALIFDACLSKGDNISDENFLVDAAVSVGIMGKEETWWRRRSKLAKARGINGVPFVIIDGKWAVNGLQPVECFIQIFRKLAQLPAPKVVCTIPECTK